MKPIEYFTEAIKATIAENPNLKANDIIRCIKCDGSGETQPDIQCKRCEGTGIDNYEDILNQPIETFYIKTL